MSARQPLAPAQQAQHRFERGVVAHRGEIEIHQRADRAFREAQHGADFGLIAGIEPRQHFGCGIRGQGSDQLRDVVGIQVVESGGDVGRTHAFDQAAAYRVGGFQQHRAAAIGVNQRPGHFARFRRQAFEHEGDVGRMKTQQPLFKRGLLLPGHQLADHVDRRTVARFGTRDQLPFDGLARQHLDHLGAGMLQVPVMRVVATEDVVLGVHVHRIIRGGFHNSETTIAPDWRLEWWRAAETKKPACAGFSGPRLPPG